jgi:hypothetical protein
VERRLLYAGEIMVKRLQFKKKLTIFSKQNRGMSTIVVTIILIALSMAAIAIVWGVVNNMIKGQIKNTQSCMGKYDKVKINKQYTCYNEVTGSLGAYTVRFSLGIDDVEIEKVVVGIITENGRKGYQITNIPQAISGLSMYPNGLNIVLPGKNAGLSYQTTYVFHSKITLIQIAPVIEGVQCEISDSISQIENCNLMNN